MASDNKSKIREFINRFFQNVEFTDEQDIFEMGFVNSLFAMQLVLFVEKEFDFAIEDGDLDIANFRSINAINALIERNTASEKISQ